jgi:hypothetical protein
MMTVTAPARKLSEKTRAADQNRRLFGAPRSSASFDHATGLGGGSEGVEPPSKYP